MSNVTVRPEQFEEAVMKALAQYGDEALDKIEQTTKDVSRQMVSELKSSAPSGGSYAKGWSHKAEKSGAHSLAEVVYNRTDYQLTHLLEKPHATGGGGQYPKNVNYTGTIARVEDEYVNKYMEEVMNRL